MFALNALRRVAMGAIRAAPIQTRTLLTMTTPLRPSVLGVAPAGIPTAPSTVTGVTDPLMAKISASPVLQSLQIRCGPRDTYDPSHRVRKRRSGFLSRVKSRSGRATLKRRQLKGRKFLSH
ncbi:60S ribosomal protein-like protein L34 [Pyronema omphalodes]|nr:60S ribosomal protein-like protein L34 [Pyronema omphalodes]